MTSSAGIAAIVAASPAPESADNQLNFSAKSRIGPHRLRRAKATEFRPAMPGSSLLMARLLLRAWPSLAIAAMASWSRKRRFRSRNGSNRDRIPAQPDGMVNTGLAFANPNRGAVGINFYFADASGMTMYSGSFNLPGGGLTSAFVDQSPFAPPDSLGIDLKRARTLTFTATAPVGVTGIRGFTNERSDFLFTTLPVAPIGATEVGPLVFAHFAQGGGWKTELILVNPTDNNLSGSANFYSQGSPGSATNAQQVVRYSIGPRASVTLQPSADAGLLVGWIRVVPDPDTPAPAGMSVFSYQANGITVTQAAVAATPEGRRCSYMWNHRATSGTASRDQFRAASR